MENPGRLIRSIPLAIALVAIAIRLAPLARSDLSFAFRPDDSFEYLQLADGMRHGCGFARLINGTCQPAEILRTPGYPLFLAAFGGNVRWVLAAQAILGGIVCLLVAQWVARYWNYTAAIAAELLIAFDLPSIVMSNEVMSEALFQFAVVAALGTPLLAASRPRSATSFAVLAGTMAAIALLIRPIGIVIPFLLPIPFLAARALAPRRRLITAALTFAIPALTLCGWSARNYYVARYPGLSTVGSINMYYYRAADIVARRRGILLAATRASFGARLGVPYERIYAAGIQSPELARRMDRMGFRVLEAHLFEAAVMTLQASIYLALSPIRSPLAMMMGTPGAFMGDGLNAGAPSASRILNTLRTILQSPLLSVLVVFEAVVTLLAWIGIAKAVIRCVRMPNEYRIWVLYLTVAGVFLMVLAAGGEADVRFRELGHNAGRQDQGGSLIHKASFQSGR
jgi:hypothetical protein